MKKRQRLLLLLQLLALTPPVVFAMIYVGEITLSNAPYRIIATIFAVMIGISLYRYFRDVKLFVYPLLPILVVSYLMYGLYDLGSYTAPQTFDFFSNSQSIYLKIPQPKEIKRVCYYNGVNRNAKLSIEKIENGYWKSFYSNPTDFPYSFYWNCVDANLTTTNGIRLHLTQGEQWLGEVRLLDVESNPIPFSSTSPHINDEPTMKVDTTYFGGSFFDEIYFARTAYEILHDMRIYETTHPYLGKIIIAKGISLFDMTPFGWRIMPLVFGAMMIVLMYYFARMVFRSSFYGFITAFLITYSFMHLTEARMALIDTFGVFFILFSYTLLYLFLRRQHLSYLLLSGVFYGLASAIKWTAVFGGAGFAMIAVYLLCSRYPLRSAFSGYKLILYGILSYGIVAVGVYGLTFYDIYDKTNTIQAIIKYQYDMFDYHQHVVSNHPYGSAWWTWILDLQPMFYYGNQESGVYSGIAAFGNPVIFWSGLLAVGYLLYKMACVKGNFRGVFLLLAFFGLYLPFAFVGRQMFIYHFYYALPFLMLIIVYVARELLKTSTDYRIKMVGFLTLVSGFFIAFYPATTGYVVPRWMGDIVLKLISWWL